MKIQNSKFKIQNSSRGFTLVELLVTIVIFVLLTSVVLFSQSGFNNSILLNNLAYDISLTIRQAQTYGVGVKEASSTFSSYGAYFDTSQAGGGNNHFVVFADLNKNGIYDDNTTNPSPSVTSCLYGSECIQLYTLKNGATIKNICVGSGNACTTQVNQLRIFFKRPKPDALMYPDNTQNSSNLQNYAKITIAAATGATTSIVISGVGQIYVSR